MLAHQISTIERFYEVYSQSLNIRYLTRQDWHLVNEVQALPPCSDEIQAMLSRLLRSVQTGRIQTELQAAA
jgi:hypothetical protein